MQGRAGFVAALVAIMFEVFGAAHAEANLASRCRRYCASAVNECSLQGEPRRRCRRRYLRLCKFSGFTACDLTPATTTTIAPPTTTTTYATTSTTFRATTTTSTIPGIPNYAGTWSFYGTLASNECGLSADYSLSTTVSIQQSGANLTATAGALPHTLYGQVTAGGFYLDTGVFSDPSYPGCYGDVRIEADGTGVHVTAALGIGVECGTTSCVVAYSGSMTL